MISPLENTGMIMRTQDFSVMRHNEDNHSNNLHVQIQDRMDKNDDANVHTVRQKDNADESNTHHDAREEGKNKYFNNRNQDSKRRKESDGVVIAKKSSGFDITI